MTEDLDLVSRLSRASRLIAAWETFELGRGHVPPEHIRYPELAKLLTEAALALGRAERVQRRLLLGKSPEVA